MRTRGCPCWQALEDFIFRPPTATLVDDAGVALRHARALQLGNRPFRLSNLGGIEQPIERQIGLPCIARLELNNTALFLLYRSRVGEVCARLQARDVPIGCGDQISPQRKTWQLADAKTQANCGRAGRVFQQHQRLATIVTQ